MRADFPRRKNVRLKNYDYRSPCVYFVTVCALNRRRIFSDILAPESSCSGRKGSPICVGEGLAPPELRLKPCGVIAAEQIMELEKRYDTVNIFDYVIMPDHIHIILSMGEVSGGLKPSPTLFDVVCAYKSLTSRICRQKIGEVNIFQRSFYEHIIRDREDYEKYRKYIHENPVRWYFGHLHKDTDIF